MKQMKPPAIRRLALAVFLMFGIMGPLTILMESQIQIRPWSFILIQTAICGGLAATMIFVSRKRWWVSVAAIIFWIGLMGLNSGGLNFRYDTAGQLTVNLGELKKESKAPPHDLLLQPSELEAIYTQRGAVGMLAIALLATGYVMFIRVIRGEVQQRERLETEVRIARDIQQSLLPSASLSNAWCSIAGSTIPATEVGGDYYDVISLPDGRVAVAVADVTGHGVGAGILSAMTKSALHSQLEHDVAPDAVLANLNRTIYEVSDEKMFVTFAYALLDPAAHTVDLGTAGHPPLLFRRRLTGRVEQHRTVSLGLGIRKEARYARETLEFGPGDMLLLYTDGVVEATNGKDEQFGDERLLDIVAKSESPAPAVCREITDALAAFSGRDIHEDDVSLLCVTFL